jgi:glycosyltransferase involved in cell wall biosynthesis
MSMKSATKPAISLIVPAFNEASATLLRSLESVALQSFGDFECLLIDESTNVVSQACAEQFCAKDPRFIRIVPSERLGLAASLNLGLSLAKADLIARFDSDDICMPTRLELQWKAMDGNSDLDVLGGALEIIDDEEQTLAYRSYPMAHDDILRKMQLTTALAHPTVMMRKSLVQAVGGYDPAFRFAEDLDLWLRLANRNARFGNLSDVLVRYRQNNVRRPADHWRYNYQARRKNFSRQYFFRRSTGIAAIGLWIKLPPILQEAIFHKMLLQDRPET